MEDRVDILEFGQRLLKYKVEFLLSPELWNKCNASISSPWNAVPFARSKSKTIPMEKKGVYAFVVKPSMAAEPDCTYLMYIGKAQRQSLRTRFLDYFREMNRPKGRPKIKRMIRCWNECLWFFYAIVENADQIDRVEKELLRTFAPPMNDELPGEVAGALKAFQ